MKWNKQSIILVAVIFVLSYIYSTKVERDLSQEIEEEQISICRQNNTFACELIEIYHDECFAQSYRSYLKAMHFYRQEYQTCLKKKIEADKGIQ